MRQKGKPRTARQERWWREVAALGCLVCGRPAEVHHAVGETARHNKQDIGHEWLIPFCWDHHQGPGGIHSVPNRKAVEKDAFVLVLQRTEDSQNRPPKEVIEAIGDYHR